MLRRLQLSALATPVLLVGVLLVGVLLAGCEGATSTADVRFSTPEHTVGTLLASYELDTVSQDAIRARLASHARFELVDRDGFEACFADLERTPAGEGLAGWVLGALAAGKDELRTTITADRATVSPREGVRIAMRRDHGGAWRIVLRDSVPEDVRRGIERVTAMHDARLRTQGIARR